MEGKFENIHKDLIAACRRGERDAQYKIYKLYYKAMFNTSLRIVNDTAEAEDIMQDSFLDAFSRLDSYNEQGSFGKWLKRIVINNSLDSLRRSHEMLPMDEGLLNLPENQDDYREDLINFQVEEVRKAIQQLPEDFRVIISLFLLEGYDHEEISDILHISNQLSRTRYSRAKQKLVAILKENKYRDVFIYN